ncbi:fructosamine kinase family protein, partial [Planctomycetota bacterium]
MKVSETEILNMAAQAGMPDCTIRPIGAGHYNDSYFIDTADETFVIRIAPHDDVPKLFYEIDMMQSEPAIHEAVLEHTDIPAPRVVYCDFSRNTAEYDYIILEFLQGHSGDFDDEELGRYVRSLHNIKRDVFGYPDRAAPTGNSWPEIFAEYAELIFKDCLSCGIIDQKEYDCFLSIYKKHENSVRECEPCLLHLDLWTQNILTENGTITAILDFDRGLYGDPELEFAVLDTYSTSTPDFFKGYGTPRPTDHDAQVRQKLYIVYELIKYAFIRYARSG